MEIAVFSLWGFDGSTWTVVAAPSAWWMGRVVDGLNDGRAHCVAAFEERVVLGA